MNKLFLLTCVIVCMKGRACLHEHVARILLCFTYQTTSGCLFFVLTHSSKSLIFIFIGLVLLLAACVFSRRRFTYEHFLHAHKM
jgi:hypothetical protein